MLRVSLAIAASMLAGSSFAADTVSVKNGLRISIIGGCHDCHTVGYGESNGKVDPTTSLKGNPVGFSGPWGVTYPANLRLAAADKTEAQWVKYLKTFKAAPPMPWYNVHAFTEAEDRSLYRYIKSLGDPGQPAPKNAKPGETPPSPYAVLAPPVTPK
jgi:hypothetical protein